MRELQIAVVRAELADAEKNKIASLAADPRTTLTELEAKLKNHQPPQYDLIPNLALACDQPLAGLITDLKQRGLLDSTLVVWGGEMGLGGPGNMNHNGSAFTWWIAGGGVRPGFAYGATDEHGVTAVENPIHVRDLHATIPWMCGLDFAQLKHNGIGFDTTCKIRNEIIA